MMSTIAQLTENGVRSLFYFHVFPDLPSEMRLKVWDYILSQPRTIEISCEKGVYPGSKRYAKSFSSRCAPPSLLHVNREARFEALNVYRSYFQTEHSPKCTYVAFDRDTIKIPDGILGYISKVELDRIQTMTIEVKDFSYFGHFNMDILMKMPSLRDLELVASNGQQYGRNRDAEAYIKTFKRDFDEARMLDPGWECPRVRIVSQVTGQEMAVIEGGPAIPGFVSESELQEDSDVSVLIQQTAASVITSAS